VRLFTVEEANALLPKVEGMLIGLHRQAAVLAEKQQELAEAQVHASSNGHSVAEKLAAAQRELDQLVEALDASIAEINDVGCVVKDVAMGLIDFPGLREGEVVNLCWRLGEPEVAFWHSLDTGFADRQPL